MLKLLGSLLLMVGAAGLGFGAAAQLQHRVTGLRALVGALEQMERELEFRLTPMPELMARLAREVQPPARYLFSYCREHLDELGARRFGQLWRNALEENADLALTAQERQIMDGLGDVLGRYDGEGQREALRSAVSQLGECLRRAEGDRDRLGRVYATLGVGAGAMLVILLL